MGKVKAGEFAEKRGDCRLWSVEQMLEEELRRVRQGDRKCTGAIVCFVEQGGEPGKDYFRTGWAAAGLTASGSVTLLRIVEQEFVDHLKPGGEGE